MKQGLNLAIKSVLLFFYCYDIAFQNISTLFSTRKLSSICFLVYFIVSVQKKKGRYKIPLSGKTKILYFGLLLLCTFSSIYLYMRGLEFQKIDDVYKAYPYPIYFAIWVLIMPLIISEVMEQYQIFFKSLGYATLFQATIIWCEYSIYDFKIWLTENIFTLSNISYMARDRATGIGASGAQLTIFLTAGIFAMGFLIIENKANFKWILGVVWTLSASFLCGRTGTYLSILVIGLIALMIVLEKKKIFFLCGKFCLSIIIVGLISQAFINIASNDLQWTQKDIYNAESAVHHIVDRAKGLGKPSGSYVGNVYKNFFGGVIPNWTVDTFLGIGIIRGEISNSVKLQHDSGYLQRIYSNGPILAVLQYVLLLLVYINLWKNIKSASKRFYFIWTIISLFLIEVKEPFIYYYMPAFTIMISFLLSVYPKEIKDDFC